MRSKFALTACFLLAACLFMLAPTTSNAAPVSKHQNIAASAGISPLLEQVRYRRCYTRYKKRCSWRWYHHKRVYRCYKVPYRYCHYVKPHYRKHYRRYH